jgi:hypothetical protein
MTTNRLETMDPAFQSRIQMAIEYPTLSIGTRRKIWTNIINAVEDEDSREELLEEIDFLKRLDLNGRQIQNVVRLAQSLAMGRSSSASGKDGSFKRRGSMGGGKTKVSLGMSHIRKVVDETSNFQQYFKGRKEVHRGQLRVNIQGQGHQRGLSREEGEDDD